VTIVTHKLSLKMDLLELVAKYPITKYLLPHLNDTHPPMKLPLTGCSRADVVRSLIPYPEYKNIMHECLGMCSVEELTLIIDEEEVIDWFIESYHNGTRDVEDFYEAYTSSLSEHEEIDYSPAIRYFSAIMTPDNESTIYQGIGYGHEFKSELLARVCTGVTFKTVDVSGHLE